MPKKACKNIHKRIIAKTVAIKTGNNKDYTLDVINKFLDEIIAELKKGNRLEFRGVGVFEIVKRKEKLTRNPRTNERILVPARKAVKFRAGLLWQREVNKPL